MTSRLCQTIRGRAYMYYIQTRTGCISGRTQIFKELRPNMVANGEKVWSLYSYFDTYRYSGWREVKTSCVATFISLFFFRPKMSCLLQSDSIWTKKVFTHTLKIICLKPVLQSVLFWFSLEFCMGKPENKTDRHIAIDSSYSSRKTAQNVRRAAAVAADYSNMAWRPVLLSVLPIQNSRLD